MQCSSAASASVLPSGFYLEFLLWLLFIMNSCSKLLSVIVFNTATERRNRTQGIEPTSNALGLPTNEQSILKKTIDSIKEAS